MPARHGATLLLAGDGGDEIFGGNQRYAKDRVMEAYHRLPAPLRALGGRIGAAAGRSHRHLLQRVGNFVARSSLPNPDRFYTDDSFASDYYDELLSADFRAVVARDASLDLMRLKQVQREATGESATVATTAASAGAVRVTVVPLGQRRRTRAAPPRVNR